MASKVAENPGLKEFTLFSKLPKELRLKVWEYAAREPRIVEVCQAQDEWYITYETEENDYESANSAPFYSPTALPVIFHISQESRAIALENYTLSFPNGSQPAQIYYNSFVDLLYFPAWCFQRHIIHFEDATPPEIKNAIRRIAIENLMWFSGWEDGTINNQIHIDEFKNLEELLLITREPDSFGCGCCHEFDGPEKGVPEFIEFGKTGKTSWGPYFENCLRDCEKEFARIQEKDAEWKAPKVRFVRLMRDGIII
jgi:2EXR family